MALSLGLLGFLFNRFSNRHHQAVAGMVSEPWRWPKGPEFPVVSHHVRPPFYGALRATFGGAARGGAPSPWVRVAIRPVHLRGRRHLQFSYFDATKDVTKNFRGREIGPRLDEVLAVGFAAVHLSTRAEEVDVRTTK